MFEEKDFLTEIEAALHERAESELLAYMFFNIDGVVLKMDSLKESISAEIGKGNLNIDAGKGRMYYVFSLFINLWNSRN